MKKRWVFKPNQAMYSLATKVEALGVRIITGVEVKGFNLSSGSDTVKSVETNLGTIDCERIVVGAGRQVRDFWNMLDLPKQIQVKDLKGEIHNDVDVEYWQLEEGVLKVEPDTLKTNDGNIPPVIHVDTDALISDVDGSTITKDVGYLL